MVEVHLYIEVDSTAVRVSNKWFGYVLECSVHGEPKTREGFGEIEGTYHKAVLTAMVHGIKRINQSCEVHIHTDNTYILRMTEENLEQWAVRDFMTTKGKPVANEEEWRELWSLSQKQLILTEPGKHIYSGWLQAEMAKRKEQESG